MKFFTLILAFFIYSEYCFADFQYFAQQPDWQSEPLKKISTGLELADINGDGWKDIVVANGNDISRQRFEVYYNRGDGTFPTIPDWESDDIDYHGNISIADIDADGDLDVAASVYIGANGFTSQGKIKIYYNISGELEKTPSFIADSIYTFSCRFGDADADGDLDLALATGEFYFDKSDYVMIFLNENGQFDKDRRWMSEDKIITDDVNFADMDMNGYPDLVCTGAKEGIYIFFAGNDGQLSKKPLSNKTGSPFPSTLLQHDIGFVSNGKYPEIIAAGNNQVNASGHFFHYSLIENNTEFLFSKWSSGDIGHGSEVVLTDINRDGLLDLIYGIWWGSMSIILGNGKNFDRQPDFVTKTNSVIEQIRLADIDKKDIRTKTENISVTTESASSIRIAEQTPEDILEVSINGNPVSIKEFSTVCSKGMVYFKDRLKKNDIVSVKYEYSSSQDIVITNWDEEIGNYIFYNKSNPDDVNEPFASDKKFSVFPNPAVDFIQINLSVNSERIIAMRITDITGKTVLSSFTPSISSESQIILDVSSLYSGIYFIWVETASGIENLKFVKTGN